MTTARPPTATTSSASAARRSLSFSRKCPTPENTVSPGVRAASAASAGTASGKSPASMEAARSAALGRGRHSVETVEETHAHFFEAGSAPASASAEGQRRPASVTSPPAMPAAAKSGTAEE